MNKRCIVNVATGDFYCKMQERLTKSMLKSVDEVIIFTEDLPDYKTSDYAHEYPKGIDLLLWYNFLPTGSRPHSESPYGFKVFAIKAAYERGYTSILWLDSPAYAVKEDISPIFEKIEKEGYYAMSHIDPLENYVSDYTLEKFRHIDWDDLEGKNLPSGSCYGFDLSHRMGKELFRRVSEFEACGDFANSAPHRHDETILGLLMVQLAQPIFTFDPLFQSDSPECVIKSGG